jgi:hypothetical protein
MTARRAPTRLQPGAIATALRGRVCVDPSSGAVTPVDAIVAEQAAARR